MRNQAKCGHRNWATLEQISTGIKGKYCPDCSMFIPEVCQKCNGDEFLVVEDVEIQAVKECPECGTKEENKK